MYLEATATSSEVEITGVEIIQLFLHGPDNNIVNIYLNTDPLFVLPSSGYDNSESSGNPIVDWSNMWVTEALFDVQSGSFATYSLSADLSVSWTGVINSHRKSSGTSTMHTDLLQVGETRQGEHTLEAEAQLVISSDGSDTRIVDSTGSANDTLGKRV